MADTKPKKDITERECILVINPNGRIRCIENPSDDVGDWGLAAGEVPIAITLRIPNSRFAINVEGYTLELDETDETDGISGRALEL
jgi:hypothetical protein